MAIIGSMGPSEFLGAIDAAEIGRIVQIPGVGKKTAERLIVELKDKLTKIKTELDVEITPSESSSLQLDIVSTLENLGYKRQQAEEAVRIALADSDDPEFETLLRKALSVLTS
jgi:Holliday junction DNA helicase RuvA